GRARGADVTRHARARLRRGGDIRHAAGSAGAHRRDGASRGGGAARSVSAPGRRAMGASRAAGPRRATRAHGPGAGAPRPAPRTRLEAVMRLRALPISLAALPYLLLQSLRQAAINARRRDRNARYVLWSALAGLASAAMLVLAIAFAAFLWSVGLWYLALAMIAMLAVPVIATAMIRVVLVPAGLHRVAYQVGLYSRPGPDPAAYAL